MSGRRFEGRSLDEAVDNAARALGVEPFQISYHIVVQKRGFLGGTKRVVIEAEPHGVNSEQVHESPPPDPSDAAPPREREETAGSAAAPSDQRPGREPRRRRGGKGRERKTAGDRVVAPPQGERSPGETRAAEWCEEIVRLLGLRSEIRTSMGGGDVVVTFFGPDVGRLTDRGGELLDSIQILANKSLVGKTVTERIELDAGDFKLRREAEISKKARDLAAVVRSEGRERLLPAMTPVERRIVHLALEADEFVATESRGEGFLKRVAIVPRESDAAAEE